MLKGQPRRGERYMKSRTGIKRSAEYTERESFYCRPELDRAIGEQAEAERESKSSIMSGILEVILTSAVGHRLQDNAKNKGIPLRQELEQVLNSFQFGIPLEKIEKLANSSQRSPEQMLVFLLLLGLSEYEKMPRSY